MTLRTLIGKAHLYLGLTTGIVVFILGVTGCLLVFQPEITHWARQDLRHVSEVQAQTLPVRELQRDAAKALGVEHLRYGLTTFRDPSRTWKAFSYRPGQGSWTYFGNIEEYRTLYIDPYTGETAGIVNEEHDFFQIMKGIHWSLLLATPIGQPIIAWSTLIFIISLVTGLVLWWPKRWNRSGRKKSFQVNWRASWKRLNYDLHNVVGFYSLVVLLIIAFTGLYWYFPFAPKTLHFLGTGEYAKASPSVTEVSAPATPQGALSPMQQAYRSAWARFPQADSITFVAPAAGGDTIRASVQPTEGVYYQYSSLTFSADTGALTGHSLYQDKSAGEKLVAMNYDLHVGAIGGLWTKILAFIASFISATLPVTGFLYWYPGWRRKRRNKQRRKAANTPANALS